MLSLRRRRDLDVDRRQHPRGQAHLSSASGLVRAGLRCYVVADDEHHLGVFGPDDATPVSLLRVFGGDLPEPRKRRKALKPDLEALLALPAASAWPHGALLGLGSGSRPNRRRGVLLPLAADGRIGRPAPLDLDALYAPLADELGPLNIEGGFFGAGECRLLQRGNDAAGVNAAIAYDAAALLAWLTAPGGAPPRPRSITRYALGAVAGVPLGFTDGAALPGGAWMFSAVAEATDDSYVDGDCLGSAIGFVGADGRLARMHRLDGAPKVEGLTGGVAAGRLHLMAVTDADDPRKASQLLCGEAELSAELTGGAVAR
jgi:hypothetical protein